MPESMGTHPRANLAHIRQSMPDSSPDFQVKVLKICRLFSLTLEADRPRATRFRLPSTRRQPNDGILHDAIVRNTVGIYIM